MWQPGNPVARKVLKNQTLTESFWILLPLFLAIKQFGGNIKEIILVYFTKFKYFCHTPGQLGTQLV